MINDFLYISDLNLLSREFPKKTLTWIEFSPLAGYFKSYIKQLLINT